MSIGKKVGIIVKESSALSFEVLLEDDAFVQLDDVLVCKSFIKDEDKAVEIKFYGVVTEVSRHLEGVTMLYQEQKAKEGVTPVNPVYKAKLNINRIEPQAYVPPKPGDEVYKATGDDRDIGLYFDTMKSKIPAGLSQDGLPIYINYDFINGKDGAHISISGMSGVATKTSYSLFLINSIIKSSNQKEKFVIFNIKGKDLLFLDKPNNRFSDKDKDMFTNLGLNPEPFKDIAFYCPPNKENDTIPQGDARRDDAVKLYGFSMYEFAKYKLLSFMFVENQQEISNLNFLIDKISSKLYKLAEESKDKRLIDDKSSRDIRNLQYLRELLQDVYENKDLDPTRYNDWFGKHTPTQTIESFLRKFSFASSKIKALIKENDSERIGSLLTRFEHIQNVNTVNVIDISDLHSAGKMFVVGSILHNIFKVREESGVADPKIFVLLDELNKYAPKDGWSPIKDVLLDIAERGRSLGVILIGAQQTASEVEKRIVANSAIKVVGRLDSAEISSEEYGFLSKSMKQRVSMLKKGSMVLYQPDIPTPVVVNIPMPPWATRKEEVKEDGKAFEDIVNSII